MCQIIVNLFYLKDPMKSFCEENRQYLQQVNFGQTHKNDKQGQNINHVEPLMPLSWYQECQNYYKAKYSHINEYREMTNEDDQFKIYFTNQKPFDINNYKQVVDDLYKQLDNIIETKIVEKVIDPDSKYLDYTNNQQYTNYEERHINESKQPFLYGQYSFQQSTGCEHCKCGCQIYCDQCNKYYWCNECHDQDQIDGHILQYHDVKQVICINCKQVQPPSSECINCHQQFTTYWCEQCKILQLNDLQTTPVFHCKIHNKCHINMDEKLHRQCQSCGECISAQTQYHNCSEIECIICMSTIYPQEDRIVLKCSQAHQVHELCWSYYIQQNKKPELLCPLCRQNVMPQNITQQNQLFDVQAIAVSNIFQFIEKRTNGIQLSKNICHNCKQQYLWFPSNICPYCFQQKIETISIHIVNAKQFIKQFLINQELIQDLYDQDYEFIKLFKYINDHKNDLMRNIILSLSDKKEDQKKSKQYLLAYLWQNNIQVPIDSDYNSFQELNKLMKKFNKNYLNIDSSDYSEEYSFDEDYIVSVEEYNEEVSDQQQ